MKDQKFISTIPLVVLFVFGSIPTSAATIAVDLDRTIPGIQTSRILAPGSEVQIGLVYIGDGETQFDTFAFDVIYSYSQLLPSVNMHAQTVGSVVDLAPLMAMDIYGAIPVSTGDALAQGDMPIPLDFDGGLGGVGVSSVGGTPFEVLDTNEMTDIINFSAISVNRGTCNLALRGFPFGVNSELSLAGENVPILLQGATIAVVSLPPAVWLFITGGISILVIGHRATSNKHYVE